jgi:hypothetical protein
MPRAFRDLGPWTLVLASLGGLSGCSSDPASPPSPGTTAGSSAGGSAGTAGSASGGAAASAGTGGGGAAGTAGQTGGGTGGSAGAAGSSGSAGSAGSSAGSGGGEGVGCAGATLCWDFEDGMLPAGAVSSRDEFNGELIVDNTKPHGGSYSLHAAALSGGTPGTAGGPKKSIKYDLPANFGPIMWGRAYVYTTPERPMSHAGLFNARYPRPDMASTSMETLDWYEVASYQEKYMSIWHPPEPPGFPEWVKVSDTPLVLDAWTCLEWLFDGENGQNAEAADPRVWLDGVELLWPEEFVFSDPEGAPKPVMEKASNFTMIETGVVMYQGLTTPTDWWIDDLAIAPQRIGCN